MFRASSSPLWTMALFGLACGLSLLHTVVAQPNPLCPVTPINGVFTVSRDSLRPGQAVRLKWKLDTLDWGTNVEKLYIRFTLPHDDGPEDLEMFHFKKALLKPKIPKNKEASTGVYDEENHGSVQWTWYNDYTYKAKAYTFQVVGKVPKDYEGDNMTFTASVRDANNSRSRCWTQSIVVNIEH